MLDARLRSVLARAGIGIVRATPERDIARTLNGLWPVQTNVDLIRIGSPHDGGYVLLDDLDGISDLFSPGVQDNWRFEEELVALTGARPHLLDCNGAPEGIPFEVRKAFLGGFTDKGQLGVNEWIQSCAPSPQSEWILQMDIEGSEFEVIAGLDHDLLSRFRGVIIELHRLDLLSDAGWHQFVFLPFLRKMLDKFVPVHLHANNAAPPLNIYGFQIPRLLEITFWRRDRVETFKGKPTLPIQLDAKNMPDKPDIDLNWCFAGSAVGSK